jgi:hypothetical protein
MGGFVLTGKPEVIDSSVRLVPTNARVLIEPIDSRMGQLGSSPENGVLGSTHERSS